jgi:hypothetical protein
MTGVGATGLHNSRMAGCWGVSRWCRRRGRFP